jgi:hypothetical protein
MSIPFKEDNPQGLHRRYYIQKFEGKKFVGQDFFGNSQFEPIFKPVDKDAEYFVLRLDDKGSDPKHIAACRKAVLTYAEEIKDHLPELSKDLKERYSEPCA